MVSLAVFALVLVGVYQVFIPVLKFANSTTERLSVQQDVRLAVDRIARDFRESDFSRLHVYPGNTAVALVTTRSSCSGAFTLDAATGQEQWQAMIYIVLDPTSGEIRRYCDPTTTFYLPAPVITGPSTLLARNVLSVAFSPNTDSVTIDLQERTPRGGAERFIRTEFVPQNE